MDYCLGSAVCAMASCPEAGQCKTRLFPERGRPGVVAKLLKNHTTDPPEQMYPVGLAEPGHVQLQVQPACACNWHQELLECVMSQ